MKTLTFDVNVLRDLVELGRKDANGLDLREPVLRLLELDEQGLCEIRLTSRWQADIPDGDLRTLVLSHPLGQRTFVPCLAQWDLSNWDEDFWATEDDLKFCDRAEELIWPTAPNSGKKAKNRACDIGHLAGHRRAQRDIFVTRDGPILNVAVSLSQELNVSVMNPGDAIDAIQRKA